MGDVQSTECEVHKIQIIYKMVSDPTLGAIKMFLHIFQRWHIFLPDASENGFCMSIRKYIQRDSMQDRRFFHQHQTLSTEYINALQFQLLVPRQTIQCRLMSTYSIQHDLDNFIKQLALMLIKVIH